MSEGFPSMTALLGLLAIAGYQNRDKISEILGQATSSSAPAPAPPQATQGAPGTGFDPGRILGGVAGGGAGGFLHSGLGEMLSRFTQAGHGAAAQSWVDHGPNRELAAPDLEHAIGPDVLRALAERTGLSRDELLSRLSRELPGAVDRYTPDGRIPA